MANPFEQFGFEDSTPLPQGAYAREKGLSSVVSFSPESQAQIDEQESNPWNDLELDREIKRTKDPKSREVLLAEKERRKGMSKVEANPFAKFGMAAQEDDVPAENPFAKFGKTEEKDSPLIHAGKVITGGVAAAGDLIGGLAGAAAGGVHGLATLATGGSMDEATKNIQDTSSKFMRGTYLTDPTIKESYERGMHPLEWLLEKSHDIAGKKFVMVPDENGKMTGKWVDNPNVIESTVGDVGTQLLAPVLGGKALGAASRATIRRTPSVVERGGATTTAGDALVDRMTKAEKPAIEATEARPDVLFGTEDGQVLHPDQVDAFRSARAEFEARQKTSEVPRSEAVQGELDFEQPLQDRPLPGEVVEKQYKRPPKGTEKDLFGGDNLAREEEARAAVRETQIDKAFDERNPAKDIIGEEYEKALEKRRMAEEPLEATDTYAPEQGSAHQIPMKMGQSKAGRGQRGAVNFGRGEDLQKRIETLKENLLNVDRSREGIKEGQKVRLMNGKTGTVSKIVGDRYFIKGTDFADSVPIQGIDYAYKPADALSNTFLRAAQKKQGGALNMGAFLRDKKPLNEIKFDEGTTEDLIRKALRQSDSPEEFARAIKMSVEDKAVNARAGELWAAKDSILSQDKSSEFSKMSKVDRQQTADVTRDADTMLKEEGILGKALTKKDDISRVARFGNVSSTQQLIHRGPAGVLLKWVHSTVNDIINQSVSLYKELEVYSKTYQDLPSKSRSRIMKVMRDYDGINNKELVDAGLQWATPDMLRSKGLTDTEIIAYQKLTAGLDEAYRINAETMRMNGKEPPPQIPGWFPHTWAGAYRVILKDANGHDFHMRAFQTRGAADRFMNKAKYDFNARMEEPNAEIGSNDIAGVTIQALEVFKNRSKLDQVILNKLNNLDKWSQQSQVRSMLERNANLGGHIAEEWQNHLLPSEIDKKIQSAYIRYMEDTAKSWANSKIAKEVKEPLNAYRDKMAETPNLQHTIDEHIARSVGKPVNHAKIIDETARAVAIYAGQDPHLMRNFVRQLNNYMVTVKLLVPNTAFAFVNSFQALTGLDALLRVHAERAVTGQPTGSVLKSTGVLLREWASFINQGKWSPEYESAVKWLEKNNKLDNFQVDLLEASNIFSKTKDPVKFKALLAAIEKHNKVASALSFYSYFRELMPARQALEAAALHMDTVMGNYNPHQASAVFTDLGMMGKGMRPFHLLPMTIYGRLAMNAKLIGDTVKGMQNKGMTIGDVGKAMAPFAAMMGTFYMLAGMQGLPGWQEWDSLARTYNSWANPDNPMPRPAELARLSGASNRDIYGLLGTHLFDLNIGPSLNAPAVADIPSMPWLDTAHAAVQGLMFAKDAVQGEPNMETAYKAARTASPPMVIPWLEQYVASKNNGMYPASNSLKGEYKRSDEQQMKAVLTGKRTITEQDQRDRNSLEKYYTKVDQDWKNEQLDKLYQMYSGLNPTGNMRAFAKKMVDSKRGFDGDSIVDGLEQRIEEGRTSAETRNKLKLANSTNAAEMARRKEIMDGLRTYFKQNGH